MGIELVNFNVSVNESLNIRIFEAVSKVLPIISLVTYCTIIFKCSTVSQMNRKQNSYFVGFC